MLSGVPRPPDGLVAVVKEWEATESLAAVVNTRAGAHASPGTFVVGKTAHGCHGCIAFAGAGPPEAGAMKLVMGGTTVNGSVITDIDCGCNA